MRDQRLAVHRTIVVVDVVGFGDQCRTNAHQVTVRDGMYQVMSEAFDRAGISWDDCDCEDRGDGVLVLVPAEVPKGLLVESLPFALMTALRGHNGAHLGPEQIRLRMALHAGEVRYDQHGVTGMAVNLAFRLLEAAPLKQALASSLGVLAVITSSWFYAEVARQTPVAGEYHCVDVAVKETTTIAWICLPDRVLAANWPFAGLPGCHEQDPYDALAVMEREGNVTGTSALVSAASSRPVVSRSSPAAMSLQAARSLSFQMADPGRRRDGDRRRTALR